jgi:hypothetical protein
MIQYPLIVIFGKVGFEPAASLQLPRLAAAGGGEGHDDEGGDRHQNFVFCDQSVSCTGPLPRKLGDKVVPGWLTNIELVLDNSAQAPT